MPGSLVELLDRATMTDGVLKQWSQDLALRSRWPYQDVRQASLGVSSAMQQKEIQLGDKVVLWGANSPQWVISYFGALRAGAVVVPFDARAGTDFLNKVIETINPRLLIAGGAQREKLTTSLAVPTWEMENVAALSGMTSQPQPYLSSTDLAEIVFTSGTTGEPKGVMLTHGNISSNVEAIHQVVPLKPKDKALSVLPISHMFETTVGLFTPMVAGASIVYTDTRRPANILQAIAEEQITCMAVVPRVLQEFRDGIESKVKRAKKEDQFQKMLQISSHLPEFVRPWLFRTVHQNLGGRFSFFVCGGAPMDSSLADFWENLGIKVLQGYGATEASPVIACDSLNERDHNFVGRPLPGVWVKIGAAEEVLIKGPNIMGGYWNDPQKTAEVLENGWYHTGDAGKLEKGKLKLAGRTKDMIILSDGTNVHPVDVERAFIQQGIREAVVFHRLEGGKDRLYVVLPQDEQRNPETLRKTANGQLNYYQRVDKCISYPEGEFPQTNKGEVDRKAVIAWAQESLD